MRPDLEQCVHNLLFIRRITNYFKQSNIHLQEWLKAFRLSICRDSLWTLEERRNRCDLIEVFKIFYDYTEIDIIIIIIIQHLYSAVMSYADTEALYSLSVVMNEINGDDKGLRDHSKKICKPRFNSDIRNYFLSNRVIDRWNSLDQDTVDAPSLNCFKNRLNKIRCTRMGFFMD